MSRALARLAVGLLAAILAGCHVDEQAAPSNLLLITLDTLRADHLGVYGYERPTSPELDRFAATATVFEDATCSMPTTLPSHASIFTGLRPAQHGLRRNGEKPRTELMTIFSLLKARGAATAGFIASRVLGPEYLAGMGFDSVTFPDRDDRYQTRAEHITDAAASWLERHRQEPFALWLHYYDTHEPYTPPSRLARAFDRGYQGDLPDKLTTAQLVGFNAREQGSALSPADLDHIVDLYDAEIAYLDLQLGRLFESLSALGILDDTVVVIVGDHGQALGESDFFGHGLRLLEPIIKVPFLLRLPGQTEGRRVAAPVETIDITPTLIEIFALNPAAGLAGRSLVPALGGRDFDAPPFRWIERRAYPDQPEVLGVALHGGDWKAVFYRDEDGSESRHLGRRAGGLDGPNLYSEGSAEAQHLEAAWRGLSQLESRPGADLADDERRMLRALGYID